MEFCKSARSDCADLARQSGIRNTGDRTITNTDFPCSRAVHTELDEEMQDIPCLRIERRFLLCYHEHVFTIERMQG